MGRQQRTSRKISPDRVPSWKQIARKAVGVFLILVGLFALFTPFSPGSWLVLVGLEFLGLRILLRDKLLSWARVRPGSRSVRLVSRLMCVWERNPAAKRKWRRLWKGLDRSGGSGSSPEAGDSSSDSYAFDSRESSES